MNRSLRIAVGVALLALATVAGAEEKPAVSSIHLDQLNPQHPRLLTDQAAWDNLRERCRQEPELDALVKTLCEQTKALLDQPPVERVLEGRRLLAVSRRVLDRVMALAFTYRITGDAAYGQRAEKEMLAAAAFSDWNPSHFLDVAEMTAALAIGYDWLHDALSPAARVTIRQAIVTHGLDPALTGEHWWKKASNNWNQVCWGGMTLGCLAIAELEPEKTTTLLEGARQQIHNGLEPYRPDGIYPEGPVYWNYGSTYQVLMIEALRSALKTDWNLPAAPGFLASATFLRHMTGPSGRLFNYADGGEGGGVMPARFWFARERRQPFLIADQLEILRRKLRPTPSGPPAPFQIMLPFWWPASVAGDRPPAPVTFWTGQGPNALAAWRTSWTDPNAMWFAIKAGGANVNHGHMDAGQFVLENDGVRWALDLGAQNYHGLESRGVRLWDQGQKGDRWQVFRLNNFSHNTLTIDGQLHRADGLARLIQADERGAEIDLTPVFGDQARRVQRTVRWSADAIEMTDVVTGAIPGATIRWAMATGADIHCEQLNAHLSQAGQTLLVQFDAPRSKLAAMSIEHPEPDFNAPNPERRLLTLQGTADAQGDLTIRVRFVPG